MKKLFMTLLIMCCCLNLSAMKRSVVYENLNTVYSEIREAQQSGVTLEKNVHSLVKQRKTYSGEKSLILKKMEWAKNQSLYKTVR